MEDNKDLMDKLKVIEEKSILPKPAIPILAIAMHSPDELTSLPQKDLMLALKDIENSAYNVSMPAETIAAKIENIVGVTTVDDEDFF